MKGLHSYLKDFINESGWNTGWTTDPWGNDIDKVTLNGRNIKKGHNDPYEEDELYYLGANGFGTMEDIDDMVGQSVEQNGTEGKFGRYACGGFEIDRRRYDDKTVKEIESKEDYGSFNISRKLLYQAINGWEDFLLLGRAGWAKTSIIGELAKRAGLSLVTVYLNGSDATDIMGIPVPDRMQKEQGLYQERAIPGWMAYVLQHPKENFLIFFDEINQATPDALNAIYPIIREHRLNGHTCNNFFVGAAGNLVEENKDTLLDLEKNVPLMQRFKTKIDWEAGTPETWAAWWEEYAKPKYGSIIPKEIMDTLYDISPYFVSPRNITIAIFDIIKGALDVVKRDPRKADLYTPETFMERFRKLHAELKTKETMEEKKALPILAEQICNYIRYGDVKGPQTKATTKSGRSAARMNSEHAKQLRQVLSTGMLAWDGPHPQLGKEVHGDYGITLENVYDLFDYNDPDGYPRELIEKFVEDYVRKGGEVKYKTNRDAEKDGLQTDLTKEPHNSK